MRTHYKVVYSGIYDSARHAESFTVSKDFNEFLEACICAKLYHKQDRDVAILEVKENREVIASWSKEARSDRVIFHCEAELMKLSEVR